VPKEIEVRIYATAAGTEPYTEWERRLGDRMARARIRAPGLLRPRGDALVVLLCGGDKGSQERDIERAEAYWRDYRGRDHGKD
jgi:putative component of toxin-antitoxin plasmid stabilization module